jgi:hypothetical protein
MPDSQYSPSNFIYLLAGGKFLNYVPDLRQITQQAAESPNPEQDIMIEAYLPKQSALEEILLAK